MYVEYIVYLLLALHAFPYKLNVQLDRICSIHQSVSRLSHSFFSQITNNGIRSLTPLMIFFSVRAMKKIYSFHSFRSNKFDLLAYLFLLRLLRTLYISKSEHFYIKVEIFYAKFSPLLYSLLFKLSFI